MLDTKQLTIKQWTVLSQEVWTIVAVSYQSLQKITITTLIRLIRKTLVRTVTAAAPAAAAAATDYQHHPGFCLTSLFSTDYSKLGQVPRRSSKNSGMTGVRFLQDRCHSCHPTVSKRNKERKKKGMKKGRKERNKERIERDRKKERKLIYATLKDTIAQSQAVREATPICSAPES